MQRHVRTSTCSNARDSCVLCCVSGATMSSTIKHPRCLRARIWNARYALALILAALGAVYVQLDAEARAHIALNWWSSAGVFLATLVLIPRFSPLFIKAGLYGRDLNKPPTKQEGADATQEQPLVPEALGLVAAAVYLCGLCFFHLFRGPEATPFYNAALASVTFMILLGFADDVLDLRWRDKMILPSVAALPLLAAYTGSTTVIVPQPVRQWFGWLLTKVASFSYGKEWAKLWKLPVVVPRLVDLGWIYKLYMLLLAVFCSNAINIHAGINGLEVGQAIVIGCAVALHNAAHLRGWFALPVADPERLRANHLFSLDLIVPFLATSAALFVHNWYPSAVFVGDTYCYFAGMCLAMAAILGHYSETLLLFFVPQVFNFLYSLPQLLGIIRCPRHRLPRLNPKTRKLEGVPSHMNLLNLVLLLCGPMTERQLCLVLMILQALCCALAYGLRMYVLRSVAWFA
jgi:UDP-N-acetylglucosamine--dolichyl-phosphate N-acetylglucosaminephosphotransferase